MFGERLTSFICFSTRIRPTMMSTDVGACLRKTIFAERPICCLRWVLACTAADDAFARARDSAVSLLNWEALTTFTGEFSDWLIRLHSGSTLGGLAGAWVSVFTTTTA